VKELLIWSGGETQRADDLDGGARWAKLVREGSSFYFVLAGLTSVRPDRGLSADDVAVYVQRHEADVPLDAR
jgi:hypothetical protein